MPWLLNLAYALLLIALSPLLLFRAVVQGKYRSGWGEKLRGAVPHRDGSRPCLWFHAVSVGEVLQLQPVLEELALQRPGYDFVISTTTSTGLDVARKRYPQHTVFYYPLDFSWAVAAAIDRVRPAAVVLVELEIWPNFVSTAAARGIPVLLINGRISERSYRGYRRIRPLMRTLLRKLSLCAVQNSAYAERLADLGASRERIDITGSIQFDRIQIDRSNPKTQELRRSFGLQPDEVVFVAGSTQAPEELFAIDTYCQLRARHSRLRLVVVPRHRERFEEVARLVSETCGLPLIRRSQAATTSSNSPSDFPPILLLDTLGELAACWGLADVAFVGGSLTRRGGQNMIEPAGFGAAVMFGPNTHNFRDVVESLLLQQAAWVVQDAADLTTKVDRLLSHPEEAAQLGARAQRLVLEQRGATHRTVELICEHVRAAIPPARAA